MRNSINNDLLRPSLFAEQAKNIDVSFEFFPPKTDQMEDALWQSIRKLEILNPSMVSVTYGAGGSTRERTHSTVLRILKETSLTPAAHLTCVSASKGEVDDVARAYADAGVRHIVALRGDMPKIGQSYKPHDQGYLNASDLVSGLKKISDFEYQIGYSSKLKRSKETFLGYNTTEIIESSLLNEIDCTGITNFCHFKISKNNSIFKNMNFCDFGKISEF